MAKQKGHNSAAGRRAAIQWLRERGVRFSNAPSNRELISLLLANPDFPDDMREQASKWTRKKWSKDVIEICGNVAKKPKTSKKSKKEYVSFYYSESWRALRYAALKRYGRTCVCCGAMPGNGVILHVDHIKPRSKYPDLELDITNLQILCEACNLGKSNTDEIDYRKSE